MRRLLRRPLFYRPVRKRPPRRVNKFLVFLILALFVVFYLITPALLYSQNIVQETARKKIELMVYEAVNSAVHDELLAENLTYDDLVSFDKDATGKISAIKTNMININILKAGINKRIVNNSKTLKEEVVHIPLGNLMGVQLLSGCGPRIPVKLIPLTSVASDFKNDFSSAGINQTRHQIILNFKVTVGMMFAGMTNFMDLNAGVCVMETVIVGAIPDVYLDGGGLNSIMGIPKN